MLPHVAPYYPEQSQATFVLKTPANFEQKPVKARFNMRFSVQFLSHFLMDFLSRSARDKNRKCKLVYPEKTAGRFTRSPLEPSQNDV